MEAFSLKYDDWSLKEETLRESLCALGNGYFVTRGAGAEASPGGNRYPGTYLAGGYNRLETQVAGRVVKNEDLVNWPNWLGLNFRIEGGRWFDPEEFNILAYEQELNLRKGVLIRKIQFEDSEKRKTNLETKRFVSMADAHMAALRWKITPLNWSGVIEVKSILDAQVLNNGVARYSDLNKRHHEVLSIGRVGEKSIYLENETTQSRIRVAQAAKTIVQSDDPLSIERENFQDSKLVGQYLRFKLEEMKPVSIDKTVAIYTSKDKGISSPCYEAKKAIRNSLGFNELLSAHCLRWEHLWNRCDMVLADSLRETKILRLHIFHLLQTASLHTIDLDCGVPARGLHGEAYRGHIFWDEMFILPFFNLRIPELSRALLMYRYRRLDEARRSARNAGYRGAMYPWQSGSNGEEESQSIHLNPVSGKWAPDHTMLQRHISSDIVYNIWQYYQASGDIEFISLYGIEIALEVARFWVSASQYNSSRGRFEIHGVVGPDEFHTKYPWSDKPGLSNNAYTNFMASWSIRKALTMFNLLSKQRKGELERELAINDEDLLEWERVSRGLFIGFRGKLILQFEGYEKLEEFDWQRYRLRYGDIQRLDRILKAEGDSTNRYKLNKQADVLMLFYLFSAEELTDSFHWLNYEFDPKSIPKNVDYYLKRSSNGSTLSRVVHAWVLARGERKLSWTTFEQALESDVADIQGGTTSEGIHLGAMAGTVDIVQRCYTGIEIAGNILWLNPQLPHKLKHLKMRICFRGHWLRLKVNKKKIHVKMETCWLSPIKVGFNGEVFEFEQGSEFTFHLKENAAPRSSFTGLRQERAQASH